MRQQSTRKRSSRFRIFRLLFFAGLLMTLACIFLVSTLGSQKFGGLHKLILEAAGPVQKVVASGVNYLGSFKQEYLDVLAVGEENKRLWQELQESRALVHKSREAMATNARLRKLLAFKDSSDLPMVAATVIGKDPSMWFRSLIIDRGTSDGVFKGSPVTNSEGIVGQVLTASPHYSKVLLAIAPSSAIDVLLQKSRVRGILKGTGSQTYRLEYVLKTVEVEEGDVVVTAGYGGMFPTGLPVGVVSKVIRKRRGMFHEIEVRPSVDYKTLEYLFVLQRKEPVPQ
ncbi:rod shape-determining protein MreC [Desulfogranum mediterraneum]|uniref:rod shape-determining protein MreC n=1 Tax=Desulfogranum mediterraneum TaxID=160661 RepID=UPI00040878B7|nr:rod shape-determining protein MreC [Desulfogranum mediterraneum]